MDSGNSGSLQSSSGGDEEYDSRAAAESFSTFISHPLRLPLQPPPPPPFDPVSNYYFQIQNSNSPLFNPNMFLPRSMNPARSDQVAYSNHPSDDQNIMNSPFMPSSFQPATEISDRVGPPLPPPQGAPSSVTDNRTQNQNQTAVRNPKKRSRASRRAPTTVLTTDTTNFRAMVQEFTGIPAPPFNSSAPFQRSRLVDLFSNTPLTSLIRSQPPPLIHRPFSQKVQPPPPQPPPPPPLPFLASTNSTSSSTSNNAAASSSTPSTSHHHHHLSNDRSSNLFNISNPILSSFFQNSHKFPFSNSINLGSKIQGPFQIPSNDNSNSKIGELDEFSLGHGSTVSPNLNALPNLISSDQIQPRRNNHSSNDNTSDDDFARWRNNAVSPDEIDRDQTQTRLVHGNYNFSRNSRNGKTNDHLGSTSNFQGEKEPENVANRNEGMVESWICSSE